MILAEKIGVNSQVVAEPPRTVRARSADAVCAQCSRLLGSV